MDGRDVSMVGGVAAGFAASWLLTAAMRRWAARWRLLDRPNERSAHTVPTPRGGGVAIVLAFSALVLMSANHAWLGLTWEASLFFLMGTTLVALIGFWDDRRHVPARWRLLCHGLGGLSCLQGLGLAWLTTPSAGLGTVVGLGLAAALVYLVWMINLCNFMDGIDGLAGVQTVTVCIGAATIAWVVAPESNGGWLPLAFAGCVAGFLVWNFPPARIFMGDVGSGYLGLVLGFLSLHAAQGQSKLFWSWLILMACFVTDASLTLLRRMGHGERFYEAHRLHAYQYAARRHGSHRKVTLAVAGLNLFWLFPLAMAVGCLKLSVALGLLLAYGPLVVLAWLYKAGDRQGQSGR